MNKNFDFRSDEIWDDSPVNDSVGDAMQRCNPIDLIATIVVALFMVMVAVIR